MNFQTKTINSEAIFCLKARRFLFFHRAGDMPSFVIVARERSSTRNILVDL